MEKAIKEIDPIKLLSRMLPRYSLLTIDKSFVRSHLDYGDVHYDQPNNKSLLSKNWDYLINAAVAIAGAIKSTS